MNYLQKELYDLVKTDNNVIDIIQDASVDGLWYWDIEKPENEWMSPKFWLILGYDPGEMPHKTSSWQEIIHPDDLKLVNENFNKHCKDPNHPYKQVLRFTHKNGSTVWIRSRGIAIRNKDGKATRMLGSHIDVTKEKENEEKYKLLFDSIDEGFCIIEMIFNKNKKALDYRFLMINASFERQTGLHDAVGKRMREFAPDHEEHWFETYGKIALTGEPYRFENRAEQLHRWYDVYAFRFGDPKNYQVAILFNDITGRKTAEEALTKLNNELEEKVNERTAELQEKYKEISDYKFALDESNIVAITDQRGIIQYVNENFCKISKYSKEELIGQDHRIVNSGHHPKEFIRNLWTTIATGRIWKGELKNKAKDGNIYWVDTTIVPFLNEIRKPYQYLAIRSDITARKKAEEELLLLNNKLEENVEQRTAQLAAVNKELESFSYSVSHDLRAPLRAINGYAKILEEDFSEGLSDEAKKTIEAICRNSQKMGNLIDDLLTFSRLGRKDVIRNTVDTENMVQVIVNELCEQYSIKETVFNIKKLFSASGDATLLKQVWVNLISNAYKYSQNNKAPVIEIGSTKNKNELCYYVKDNGVGFDMKYYGKLFGVFQRLHSENEFEGTGVGLAIVHRIVNRHGGRVWAEAKINEGACFYFTIPKN